MVRRSFAEAEDAVKVEIWSDVVCPWCYIGKRRFESALGRFGHRDEVEIEWRSFELDPSAPARREGDNVERLARKYGMSITQAQAAQDRVVRVAEDEGLAFDFASARGGNTADAHQLIHLAFETGGHVKQGEMKERLLSAYFIEGEPIGDRDTLIRLAAEVGLDPDVSREALEQGARLDAVRRDERDAAALGVSGVPFFVVDRRYAVSGAQDPDVLLQMLETAWADAHPLTILGVADASEAACTDDTCIT